MHSVIIQNEPLIRPLYYDFPEIMPYVENVTHHFMVGESLLAVPVTLPLVKHVSLKINILIQSTAITTFKALACFLSCSFVLG